MSTRSQAKVADVPLIDGSELKKMFLAGGSWLKAHINHINRLNVFPVPDGDTGTNMWLTLKAAQEKLATVPESHEAHAGQVAALAAEGALMGARGNSGVILSQILQGFAEAIAEEAHLSHQNLALAFETAKERAYAAVINPVEGTILTIISTIAETSRRQAAGNSSLAEFWSQLVQQAQLCLSKTPTMLPTLKAAGVVDSGGQGLVYFMEGIERHLRGLSVELDSTVGLATRDNQPPTNEARLSISTKHGYDVQFLIRGFGLDVATIRQKIDAMGDSTLVVGNEERVKVHVHVQDPGQPLSFGATQGVLSDVVVENMDHQAQVFSQQNNPAEHRSLTPNSPTITLEQGQIGLICVAPGPGFSEIFRSLGGHHIIYGGQGINPSTQSFIDSINRLDTEQILVLPNHKNIIATAQQARKMSHKAVEIIPSTTLPQGISALLAFNAEARLLDNKQQMIAALNQIESIEITYAARSSRLNGLNIKEGHVVGLLNGQLIAHADQIDGVLLDILNQNQLKMAELELLSLYYGREVDLKAAETLGAVVKEQYPHLEVEILPGGQAHYPYIVSLE